MPNIPKIGVINPPPISSTPFKDKMEELHDKRNKHHEVAAHGLHSVRSNAKNIDRLFWGSGLAFVSFMIIFRKKLFHKK